MKKKFLRGLGAYFLIDGLMTMVFGRTYVRLYRFGSPSNPYREAIERLLDWPAWQLRAAGMGEAFLGAAMLRRAPLDVQTLYRNIAGGYTAIDPHWRTRFYPEAHDAFDRSIERYLPGGGDVLDLGSGLGANLERLHSLNLPFGSYTGVDLTRAMLRRADEQYGHLPGVRFQQLDLMEEPLPEGPYDLVLSTWVFEHLPDPVLVTRKAWDQLRPGGHLVLLFEVETDTLLSGLINRVYPFFSARQVREEEIRRMPGVTSVQRFSGPLGVLALVTAEKPLR